MQAARDQVLALSPEELVEQQVESDDNDTLYTQTIATYRAIMEANKHFTAFMVNLRALMAQTPKDQRLLPLHELTSPTLPLLGDRLLELGQQMDIMRRVAFPSAAQYREFVQKGQSFTLPSLD